MSEQVWSGRFQKALSPLAMAFGASLAFDRRLALHDVRASLAHAHMLARQGILSSADETAIEHGLSQIADELRQDRFIWREEREDVHLNIEGRLTELAGEAGKRLHTARSRNDQTVTSLRLWLRDETDHLLSMLTAYRNVLLDLAEKYADLPMPGYTHLQVAQPITLGHHWMAYDAMAARDQARLQDARQRINVLPLGAAALAGTSYPIDRQQVARELGFAAVCENSIDAVSDRDFALEFTFASATLMIHLSRLSEELILWASRGLVHLPEDFCTGSSIMPQKINPDVPELVRGKAGRVCGHLLALLMLMKGQPLAYNKDNQEDKEPLFDTVDTTAACLAVLTAMLPGLRFDAQRLTSALERYATATDLADYLVRQGMAFRDAHEAVSRIVRDAEAKDCDLQQLTLMDIRRYASNAQEDVMNHLTIKYALNSRNHLGGTAPQQVREAISRARQALSAEEIA